MRVRLLSTGAMLTVVVSLGTPPAQAQTCQSLWTERNQIYKDSGYCFKTQRAIDFFGNDGCSVNNENALRLSRSDRQRIDEIVRLERAKRCS